MEVFRYWIGASPEAPFDQARDLDKLHDTFHALDGRASVEQYGILGGMILLQVETEAQMELAFEMPATVVAFEHRSV
jgi:hypothetical protein